MMVEASCRRMHGQVANTQLESQAQDSNHGTLANLGTDLMRVLSAAPAPPTG